MKRYTIADWIKGGKGQTMLSVQVGYWKELGQWPAPGRIFRWYGRLPELWYYVKCRLWKRFHVITVKTLPPTWQDADERMLHAMFEILRTVIERERIFESNAPEGDPTDGQSWAWALAEMRRLWDWWTIVRPAREAEYERRLHAWSVLRELDVKNGFPLGDQSPAALDAWIALREFDEEVTGNEDEEMLHALIRVRRYLWT